MRRFPVPGVALLAAVLATALPQVARSAGVAADTQIASASAAAAARLPPAQTFTATANGSLTLTLTDLGASQGGATPFTALRALVSLGGVRVASLDAAGSVSFDAQPGTYKVHVVGNVPAQFGLFRAEVRNAGGSELLVFSDDISAASIASPPVPPRVALQPGTYQVSLHDRAFPAALQSIDLLILRVGGDPALILPGPCAATACSGSFTVTTAGDYDLIVGATAAAGANAGLYTLSVTGPAGGAVVEANAYPVGTLAAADLIDLPQTGSYTLRLADVASLSAPLAELRAVLTQGATVLASRSGTGEVVTGGAQAGAAGLFLYSRPGVGGVGAFSARLLAASGQTVFEDARPVPLGINAARTGAGYRYLVNVPGNGSYQFVLKDHNLPATLAGLSAFIVQNGTIAQSLGLPGNATVNLAAGSAFVVVTAAKAATGSGLFGLSLALDPAAPLLAETQGIGELYGTRAVTIPAAGSYDLTAADLAFPTGLQEFAVAVTRGPELISQLFGGGTVTFDTQPGTHSISVLAKPATAADYGAWGFEVAATPPPPTVSLDSSAASVPNQGTVTLAWSSTGATGCTASGGWSGSKAASGTETSAALTAQTTFNLLCTGPGGTASDSVTVTISTASPNNGGSGSTGAGFLMLCGALLWSLLGRRRSMD